MTFVSVAHLATVIVMDEITIVVRGKREGQEERTYNIGDSDSLGIRQTFDRAPILRSHLRQRRIPRIVSEERESRGARKRGRVG